MSAYFNTFGGNLFDIFLLRATSLADPLQFMQKHCYTECQSTTGP